MLAESKKDLYRVMSEFDHVYMWKKEDEKGFWQEMDYFKYSGENTV